MTLKQLADETVVELERAFPDVELTDDARNTISKIVERTLIKTVEQAEQAHRTATRVCCGAEADMAHKINEEVKRANVALTANLMALR